MTDDDVGPDTEVVCVAHHEGEVYVYEGTNAVDFPLHLDGVTCPGRLRIGSDARRVTLKLQGAQFFTRARDSDDGQALLDLVDDLRDADHDDTDELLDVIDDHIERHDA